MRDEGLRSTFVNPREGQGSPQLHNDLRCSKYSYLKKASEMYVNPVLYGAAHYICNEVGTSMNLGEDNSILLRSKDPQRDIFFYKKKKEFTP
jgi:hypothetical protein